MLVLYLTMPSNSFIILITVVLAGFLSWEGIGVDGIYHGRDAPRNKFLWVAQIRTTGSELACHAALISSQWVLTLASCVVGAELQDVVVGDYNRAMVGDGEEVAEIKQVIVHPDNNFLENNVALIELAAPVNVTSPSIDPITTFSCSEIDAELDSSKRKSQIAGWGESLVKGMWKSPDILQELKVVKEKDQVCSRLGLTAMDNYSCFKMGRTHAGPCTLDNGTPVVYKVNGKRILVGLIFGQFSVDGCIGGLKIVSRASCFKTWVQQYVPDIE